MSRSSGFPENRNSFLIAGNFANFGEGNFLTQFSLRSSTKFFFFFVETLVSGQLRRSWFDNNRLNTWQFTRLDKVLVINKLQIWPIYLFCTEGLITFLNQEMKVDCLLIAFVMTQLVIFACKAFCLFTATVAPSNRRNRHIYINTLLNKHNQQITNTSPTDHTPWYVLSYFASVSIFLHTIYLYIKYIYKYRWISLMVAFVNL